MNKYFIQFAAYSAAIAVGLGAFAAHGLKKYFEPDLLQIFETGVKYQMYHSLALLATGILFQAYPTKYLQRAGQLLIGGIILFSGSLYGLCFIKFHQLPALWVGAITPLGGLCFITGWILLALGLCKKTTQ